MIKAQETSDYKALAIQGMTFQWRVEASYLHCKVTAPTIGWVAVGFNTRDELEGTNLIMGCVENGHLTIQDRYILKAGVHKSKLELGRPDNLSHKNGAELNDVTTISFALPLNAQDQYTHALVEGQVYHLLLAYSWEDDFNHHSAMRTWVVTAL